MPEIDVTVLTDKVRIQLLSPNMRPWFVLDLGPLHVRWYTPWVWLTGGHELGHAIASLLLHRKPVLVTDFYVIPLNLTDELLQPSGTLLEPSSRLVALAGPVADIAISQVFLRFILDRTAAQIPSTYISAHVTLLALFLILSSLFCYLGLLNLIPNGTNDGTKVFRRPAATTSNGGQLRELLGTTGCAHLHAGSPAQYRKAVLKYLSEHVNSYFGIKEETE